MTPVLRIENYLKFETWNLNTSSSPGWVFWITGLSGSGKSSVARDLFRRLRGRAPNSLLLDGDDLRKVFEDLGYTLAERRRCAHRYGKLCQLLASQGLHVVVATISMFHEVRDWNRQHLPRYVEVYLRADVEALAKHPKGELYRRALRGEVKDVVGVDLSFEAPRDADLVFDCPSAGLPSRIAAQIWEKVEPRLDS